MKIDEFKDVEAFCVYVGPIVKRQVRKMNPKASRFDDWLQEGLEKACYCYGVLLEKPDIEVEGYVAKAVKNLLIDKYRKGKSAKGTLEKGVYGYGMENESGKRKMGHLLVEARRLACQGQVLPEEQLQQLKKYDCFLTRSEREVIQLYFLQGISQVEIGRMLNISASAVSKRRQRGFERIEARTRPRCERKNKNDKGKGVDVK